MPNEVTANAFTSSNRQTRPIHVRGFPTLPASPMYDDDAAAAAPKVGAGWEHDKRRMQSGTKCTNRLPMRASVPC